VERSRSLAPRDRIADFLLCLTERADHGQAATDHRLGVERRPLVTRVSIQADPASDDGDGDGDGGPRSPEELAERASRLIRAALTSANDDTGG
jgi:hypothetical protein